MDPLTLFALANGAVSAVKAGCKLYKDIKGAAGEVKDVLKDLDNQFQKLVTLDCNKPAFKSRATPIWLIASARFGVKPISKTSST